MCRWVSHTYLVILLLTMLELQCFGLSHFHPSKFLQYKLEKNTPQYKLENNTPRIPFFSQAVQFFTHMIKAVIIINT